MATALPRTHTDQVLDRARVALDATPSDSPNFTRVHRAFCDALDANNRYHACDLYSPAEGYGSSCADCGESCTDHAGFNPNGGAW